MDKNKKKRRMRLKRHAHIRKNLEGTPDRPRLCVFRSNLHIYAQVIDDINATTLISLSTVSPELKDDIDKTGNMVAASKVGTLLGQKCIENGVDRMVFDRGGYKYHGRVRELAESVRRVYAEEGKKVF